VRNVKEKRHKKRIVRAAAGALLNILSSWRLALVLVIIVILISIAGAMLPQEAQYTFDEITRWQEVHPVITTLLRPLGLFRAFHSVLFLVTVSMLAVNTLTCTVLRVLRVFKEGGITVFIKGPAALRNTGFIILHLCIIAICAGGVLSTGFSMDGLIILTEGQVFKEEHSSYIRLVEGPLRQEHHQGFLLRLAKVRVKYEKGHTVEKAADVETRGNDASVEKAEVKVNVPLTYRGLDFTLDEVGFSPRVVIRDKKSGRLLVNSFVALKTFRDGQKRTYRDFLPLPVFLQKKQRIVVTVIPAPDREQDQPLLLVDIEDDTGKVKSHGQVPMNGTGQVGEYLFGFTGLRRCASFRVMEDPGYDVILIALWLGFIGILLRYIPDLRGWLKEDRKIGR
jgi:cytochrome c biogenesis protein ResB